MERSKGEAFDEISASMKLMLITRVRRRCNINVGDEKYLEPYLQLLTTLELSNLMSLLGNQISEEEKVYKYRPKESLYSLLHSKKEFLTWDRRKEIAEKVSFSLAFLHESGMVYGKVNLIFNVLLDHKGRVFLADSCLVARRLYSRRCPKYLSKESDVYSFGVLLLELLTGKDPCRTISHLPELIFSIDDERWAMEMLDERLRSYIDIPSMLAMYRIAKQCTSLHEHTRTRPRMTEVVEMITE